ncbi:MAG: response regulator transcription factor [Bdellovibrionales bacterium]|nr:response regulator transcription factor [Bdellovibrionales bacterium]
MKTATSILLVDDSVLVRKALKRLISEIDGVTVDNEAGNLADALAAVDKQRPDLIVSELALPGPSGIEILFELRRRKLKIPFLALTRCNSLEVAEQAIKAGADGYLTKNATEEELRNAVASVCGGSKYLSGDLDGRFHDHEVRVEDDPLSLLSNREREIFHLLANGLQNSSIARKLLISPRTVETHRARIVQKLGISSNAELIHFAVNCGLAIP